MLSVEKLGNTFNQTSIPLRYTPRRFVINQQSKAIITIESEHQALSSAEKAKQLKQKEGDDDGMDLDIAPSEDNPLFEPKAQPGKWASCLRVLEPFQGAQLAHVEFEGNEAATWFNFPPFFFIIIIIFFFCRTNCSTNDSVYLAWQPACFTTTLRKAF